MPSSGSHTIPRRETRIPMEIPVVLDGHRQVPGTETTFTENVSVKGARVTSVRRWEKGSPLFFASRTGEFRSAARVAYCQAIRGEGYAVGVEFLESQGRWVVESQN
jgi:hypothetical protein